MRGGVALLGAALRNLRQHDALARERRIDRASNESTFAMMPIGWPIDAFGPLSRRPLSEVACADLWGKPWPA
jgi:hypothetical protein